MDSIDWWRFVIFVVQPKDLLFIQSCSYLRGHQVCVAGEHNIVFLSLVSFKITLSRFKDPLTSSFPPFQVQIRTLLSFCLTFFFFLSFFKSPSLIYAQASRMNIILWWKWYTFLKLPEQISQRNLRKLYSNCDIMHYTLYGM